MKKNRKVWTGAAFVAVLATLGVAQGMVFRTMVIEAISKKADQPVEFTIRRNGQDQTIAVTPRKEGDTGKVGMYMLEATRSFKPDRKSVV